MRRQYPQRQRGAPVFEKSHDLVCNMQILAGEFLENPRGEVGRMWVVDGKKYMHLPAKAEIEEDEDEHLDE